MPPAPSKERISKSPSLVPLASLKPALVSSRLHETGAHLVTGREQGFDFATKRAIRGASAVEKSRAFLGRDFQRLLDYAFNLLPAVRRDHCCDLLISRCSQTCAVAHSRFTVAGEMLKISA